MVAIAIGATMILSGIALDLFSLLLGLRRLRGNGPSGVPIVSLFFYMIGVPLISETRSFGWMLFGVLVLFHFMCQLIIILIAYAVLKWWGR